VALDAGSSQATYDFACEHGVSPAIVPDASGAFTVQGTAVPTGGAIPTGPAPEATFSGTVSGDTITLTITVSGNPTVFGPFTLAKGVVPEPLGCI